MKKKLFSFFAVFTLLVNISVSAFGDNALNDSKVRFNQINGQVKQLDEEINSLTNNINNVKNTIDSNNKKIDELEKQMNTTEEKIKDTQKNIDAGQDVLSDRLRAMYKTGSYSPANYVAYIFESNGLSDMISRIYTLEKIINTDNNTIKSLNKNKESLQNDVKNLNKQKQNIENLNKDNTTNLNKLVVEQNKLKDSKEKLNAEMAKVQSVIQENEEKLISHPIDVVDSSSSSINDLEDAVKTLKELLPQLSTPSVKDKVNEYISKGNQKIEDKKKEAASNSANNDITNVKPNNGGSKKSYTMEATAYSGHGITAMGIVPTYNPNGLSTVAVDPSVIPLGSKVYVSGYGYAIAADTGGAIVGNKIDLFMNNESQCYSFGRRTVKVDIIAYPGEW